MDSWKHSSLSSTPRHSQKSFFDSILSKCPKAFYRRSVLYSLIGLESESSEASGDFWVAGCDREHAYVAYELCQMQIEMRENGRALLVHGQAFGEQATAAWT